jgi:hypothetical protein
VYACAATITVSAQQVRANPLEFVDGDPTPSSRIDHLAGANMHTYTYTRAFAHKCIHIYIHTDRHTTYTYIQTDIQHTHILTDRHTGIQKGIRASIDT